MQGSALDRMIAARQRHGTERQARLHHARRWLRLSRAWLAGLRTAGREAPPVKESLANEPTPVFALREDCLRAIERTVGRPFTHEAYVGSVGPLVRPGQPNADAFVGSPCAGQHVWIHPPAGQEKEAVLWYRSQKKADPRHTSACVLIPAAALQKETRRMQCLHTFEVGEGVLQGKTADGADLIISAPHRLRVYYDPPWDDAPPAEGARPDAGRHPPRPRPKPAPTVHLSSVGKDRLIMEGTAAGVRAAIAFDTGASHCFLNAAWAQQHGVDVTPLPDQVVLADGSPVRVQGTCSVRLQMAGYVGRMRAYVLPLAKEHDILLGMDWLRAHGAVIDCQKRLVRLQRGRRTVTILQCPAAAMPEAASPTLSAAQAWRAIRNGAQAYLCVVKASSPAGADEDAWPAGPEGETVASGAEREPELRALLTQYKDVLRTTLPAGLPPERGEGHTIPLEPGAAPPCKHMYRMSRDEHAELETQIKDLLERGFIEPSDSPFGAPLLLIRKKDGGFRMVLDYRALNAITVKNKYPLPRIEDLLDRVTGHKWFSGLDLASGYWQIRIRDEDVPKTAFRTPLGSFQWRVLPMGITNAPSTFQRVMNTVFRGLLNKAVLIYLDDLLVIGRTKEEHLANLQQVLQRLRDAKLYCRLQKCQFLQQEVEFLGFVVGKDGLKVDPKKVKAVVEWPTPTDAHQLRSFLGLSNYFRRFLIGYSKVVAPLTALFKKDTPWLWTPERASAFAAVKHMLTSAPVLQLPDLDKPFVVVCDASNVSLGACLMQDGHPIAFESAKLKPNELNYHAGEKELLAVVHALRLWRCYLSGAQQFTVVTDHNPNTTFDTKTTLSDRQARWVELLSRFNFVWKYIPGRTNVADPLSRRPDGDSTQGQLMAVTRKRRLDASAPAGAEDACNV